MTHSHNFSESLFARIQGHAIPLVDGLEDVISRAFDALEESRTIGGGPHHQALARASARAFDPGTSPDLTHTTLLSLSINGEEQFRGVYWNTLMHEALRHAGKSGMSAQQIMDLMEVPAKVGEFDHYSYTYIKEADISVQGQNANRAWKQALRIAQEIDLKIGVAWVWQNKAKAHMPNVEGTMTVNG